MSTMPGSGSAPTRRLPLSAAVLAAAALLPAACVERKMVLRSEPPGAVAYVDDERVGITPCETPFSHYGTRHVVLEYRREVFLKANGGAAPPGFEGGFRRVIADAPLGVPWYQWPVLDLITEIAIPFTITDTQEFVYSLEPREPLPTRPEEREALERHKAGVLERARVLREHLRARNEEERARRGTAETPAPGTD